MNNQKGFANIALIFLVIVLAGAVGYFVLFKKSPEVAQQTNTPTPTPTQTKTQNPTPAPTPKDETENWKTYTNTQYGFEVRYPDTFTYKTLYEYAFFDKKEQIDAGCNDGIGKPFCGFSFEGAKRYTSITKAIEAIPVGSPDTLTQSTRVLGGNTFTVVRRSSGTDFQLFYLIEKNGLFFTFFVQQSYAAVADQILSTFRFTK